MNAPIRAYPLTSFTILACLFGWASFIASALGADVSPENIPLGPIIAAAIVAAGMGRSELREWGRQLVTFRASPGWYALAILAPAAIIIAAVLVNHAFGEPLPAPSQLAGWTALPGTFLTFLILIGIGEEAGWTAFAAPRLLNRHTFIAAWLILSAIRILWHLPLMLTGLLPWVLGIGGNIAFQFLVLWIFVRSGGVWFLAAIWHAVLNTLGGQFFFRMVQGEAQERLGVLMTAGYVLVAAAVFLVDCRRIARTPGAGQQPR
jgi:membrane protease YdiL (CAAX protease family)